MPFHHIGLFVGPFTLDEKFPIDHHPIFLFIFEITLKK